MAVTHTVNPSGQGTEAGESFVSLKLAWLKQQVLGYTGIHNETLSQAKQNKTKQILDSLLLQLFTVSITSERGAYESF